MKQNYDLNVLQVLPKIPYGLGNGGDIAIFAMTKAFFNLKYNVDWIGFQHQTIENSNLNNVKELVRNVVSVSSDKIDSNIIDYVLSIFQPYPYLVWKYRSREYQIKLDSLLKNNQYNVVQFEHINTTLYAFDIRKKTDAKIVLRAHSLNTHHYKNLFHLEKNYFKKVIYFIEYLKYKNYEHKIFNLFDTVLYITEEEEKYFLSDKNSFKSAVIPLAIDRTLKKYKSKNGRLNLLWIGDLSIMQHRRSIEIFLKNIVPHLINLWPDLTINIVGKNPGRRLLKMGKKNIIFWGFQKNIENFYNKADVFFAPLFAGNGLKVKIVNAIMNGLPVITTPIGAEGFGRLKNKYLFICKNKMDYIDSLTTIVNNKSKTKEMVLSAQKHIKNTMNLDVISKQLEKIYNSP